MENYFTMNGETGEIVDASDPTMIGKYVVEDPSGRLDFVIVDLKEQNDQEKQETGE